MSKTTNVMIVGVGGQGTLLASKTLGKLLLSEGFDVKVSEVHGMSQRGGSVVTYVRFEYLRPDGQIITNLHETDPMPVITGAMEYPQQLIEKMEALGAKIDAIDALSLAEEAGSSKAVNMVLMGRLSKYFEISEEAWMKAIEACVPPKFLELNKKAFALGKK